MAEATADWTNRRGVIVACVVAMLGVLITVCSNQPKYHPSAIFQPKNGEEAQRVAELTDESATCDEAIRSLLLAVSNEIVSQSEITPRAQVASLVESDFALVPPACQEVIDPRSVASDGDLKASVVSVRNTGHSMVFNIRIANIGEEPVYVGYNGQNDRNVMITDDRGLGAYKYYDVGGVHTCDYLCKPSDEAPLFTKIDPGASASLTIEGNQFESNHGRPRTASLSISLLEAENRELVGSLSFGFDDVPID